MWIGNGWFTVLLRDSTTYDFHPCEERKSIFVIQKINFKINESVQADINFPKQNIYMYGTFTIDSNHAISRRSLLCTVFSSNIVFRIGSRWCFTLRNALFVYIRNFIKLFTAADGHGAVIDRFYVSCESWGHAYKGFFCFQELNSYSAWFGASAGGLFQVN